MFHVFLNSYRIVRNPTVALSADKLVGVIEERHHDDRHVFTAPL